MSAAWTFALYALAGAAPPLDLFRRGQEAFRAGEYSTAAGLLDGLAKELPRTRDYVLYLAAESEFYAGRPARSRRLFEDLVRGPRSPLRAAAAFRVADCQWAEGDRTGAVAHYRRLLGPGAEGGPPADASLARQSGAPSPAPSSPWRAIPAAPPGAPAPDLVVARFRVALVLAEQAARSAPKDPAVRARALRALRAIHLEFPGHPLAERAAREAGALSPPAATQEALSIPAIKPTAAEQIARAETLASERLFAAAVKELENLPAGLSAPLAAERDYLLGMTLYKMRSDYARSAELLLRTVDVLAGEKAASAAFHGTRALSRVHRDDEAIAGYLKMARRFPASRFAPEAQFLAGWLELNRGRIREAIPGLEETVRRFPGNPFAEDAAWFTALSHVLLGDGAAALPALDRFERLARRGSAGAEAGRRVQYFRGRALRALGRKDEARAEWRTLAQRQPFSYYGLLAVTRLRELGEPTGLHLPQWTAPPEKPGKPGAPVANDQMVARVSELAAAGLDVEAGLELQREEAGVLSRLGRDRALPLLLDLYPRFSHWRRSNQLAEIHGATALASVPSGAARTYWEAAYPRAFSQLVERYGPPAGNPDLFLYAIMLKESRFLTTDVSYADARGLLQMLPATSTRVAAELELPFSEEQLFVPEVNVRLAAHYIGGLARKFHGDVALAAGAYNAGAPSMMRWCDRNGSRPLDDFVELVTYEQTREYIKRVLQIFARYHHLYKGQPLELPLALPGCRYHPGGPNY